MSSSSKPPPTATRSILVLGAGELGLPTLTHLSALASSQPYPVQLTVLLRPSTISNPSSSKARDITTLKNLGISLLGGDLISTSPTDLAALFRPYHTIIDCSGYGRPKGGQLHVARAVLAAGIRKYIPWQFGVDYDVIGRGSGQDLFDEQLDLRDLLRAQSTTSWVVVSTGMFTSFLFEPWFGVVESLADGGGIVAVRALGSWENGVSVTSPEDIGRVTARVVFDDGIRDTVVFSASDTVTYQRLADVVEEVVGQPVKREAWTLDYLRDRSRQDPENVVVKYRVVFAEGRGLMWKMEDTINHKWNMQLEDVRTYALAHLKLQNV
jgi:NmrA-like family